MLGNLFESVGEKLFLESGIFINGNREVIIDNCRRIEEYNEICVRVISGGLSVEIWGSGLRAFDFKSDGLVVRGRISRVELAERRAKSLETEGKGENSGQE